MESTTALWSLLKSKKRWAFNVAFNENCIRKLHTHGCQGGSDFVLPLDAPSVYLPASGGCVFCSCSAANWHEKLRRNQVYKSYFLVCFSWARRKSTCSDVLLSRKHCLIPSSHCLSVFGSMFCCEAMATPDGLSSLRHNASLRKHSLPPSLPHTYVSYMLGLYISSFAVLKIIVRALDVSFY